MKVATVTVHSAISYGAMLQAFALRKVLSKMGVDAEVLDYRNKMIEDKNRTIPRRPEASLGRFVKDVLSAPLRYDRNRRFKAFMRQYMGISPERYCSGDDLTEASDKYDLFFVGSDQVWNPKHGDFDPVYFLQFTDAKKRNSYAASFGFSEIPQQLKDQYYARLKDFNNIAVREESAVGIVKDLTGKNAVRTLDPTLLLCKEEWLDIAKPVKGRSYILLYEVNRASKKNYDTALAIAREKGLRVISITQSIRSLDDLVAHQTGPDGLLGYINGAEYVLTDSFHGIVFSILLEKPFVFCENGNPEVDVRMNELLDLVGLSERRGSNRYGENIDWAKVASRLSPARKESLGYIKKVLEEYE